MTQEQIIEGNKLIGEFMKIKINHAGKGDLYKCPATGLSTSDKELEYHSSWDWLMSVVEKIESMGYDVFINGLYCRITDCGMSDFELESGEVNTKIEAIWFTVIEFIKWYNSCQKEENLK